MKWITALMRKWWRFGVPLLTWLAIRLMPVPPGLEAHAWHYFALFTAVIIALILEPVPSAAVGLIGVTAATVIGYVESDPNRAVGWALTGFSNPTVWLIFGAYTLSIGYERSGLGRRMGLILIKHLGGRTLGLRYAIALADLVTAPGTPSNTARSAGIIYPIVRSIPELFGSSPGRQRGESGPTSCGRHSRLRP